MQYYGTRLSDNISRREPEGYLLCLNVPVARTGTQDYLPEELGLPPGPDLVSVFRPEEEVFAPEALASFEGMPVTNDHPAEGVDIDNIRRLQMGHAHNVRRGSGEESDLLLADLIITDERLIDAILSGKREISCGYTYELHEENGQYFQRKIRGNHIAVVDAGRAGSRVSIKDMKPDERSTFCMKKSLCKILARMARDGDIDTVAEIIGEMIGEPETAETPAEAVAEAAAEAVEAVEEAVEAAAEEPAAEAPAVVEAGSDEDNLAGIIQRLDKLIELLTPAPAAADEAAEEISTEEVAEIVEEAVEAAEAAEAETTADPEAEEVAELVEAILNPEASVTLEDAESGEECGDPEPIGNDALRAALSTAGPALARMSREQRRKACADIAARVKAARRKGSNRGYDTASQGKGRKEPEVSYAALGKRIMAARNPNYRQ